MKRLEGETDSDYIERLENHCDTATRYLQRLEHLIDEYKSGSAKLDLPSSENLRGPNIFALTDAEKVEWDTKTSAMRQPADSAEAYDLRLRLETAELKVQLTNVTNAILRNSLSRWESDPELVKTMIAADYMHDREQQATEERRKGGQKTGSKTARDSIKNRELAESVYAALREKNPSAKPADAFQEYHREAKAADLKPWGRKYFISQVKSASA